jgi:hypothetical protein
MKLRKGTRIILCGVQLLVPLVFVVNLFVRTLLEKDMMEDIDVLLIMAVVMFCLISAGAFLIRIGIEDNREGR